MASSDQIYHWFKRYRVLAEDMEENQELFLGHPNGLFEGMMNGSVLMGLRAATTGGMSINIETGVAVGATGYLHVPSATTVAFTAPASLPVRSLVVARPVLTDFDYMTNPTNPFETVPLRTTLGSAITLLPGTAASSPVYPASGANDVVLCGVRTFPGQTSINLEDIDFTVRENPGRNAAFLQNTNSYDDRLRPFKVSNQVMGIRPSQYVNSNQRQFKASANNRASIFPKTPAGEFNGNDTFVNFQTGAVTGGDGATGSFVPQIPSAGNAIVATVLLTTNSTLSVSYGTTGTRTQCHNGIRNQQASGPGSVSIPTSGQPIMFVIVTSSNGATVTEIDFFDARGILQGGGGAASSSGFVNFLTNGDFEQTGDGAVPENWATYAESESVTFTDAGDIVTVLSGLPNINDTVSFTSIVSTTGIVVNTLYFVVNPTGLTFQLALTAGGSAIALTTNGSGTMVRGKVRTGSGGTANITFIASTTAPLDGNVSVPLVKDAANRMGQGVARSFTIPLGWRGAKINLITTLLGANVTNYNAGDLTFWIVDVTTGAVITPSVKDIPKANAPWEITFFSTESSSSYRLCIHVSTPNVTAYSPKFDDFVITPNKSSSPAPVNTEWRAYTPSLSGAVGAISGFYKISGDTVHVKLRMVVTSVSGTLTFGAPPGYTPAAGSLPGNVTNGLYDSAAFFDASASNGYTGTPFFNSSSTIQVYGPSGAIWSSTVPVNGAAGDLVTISLSYPANELIGSGTNNYGSAASVEYLFNSGTWNTATELTSFAIGVQGAQMGGALTQAAQKRVQCQSDIQPDDDIVVQVSDDRILWIPVNSAVINNARVVASVNSTAAAGSGCSWARVAGSTRLIDIFFAQYQNMANDDSPVTDWPSNAFWRVRKCKANVATGFGKANSIDPGLVTPRKGETSLAVTSSLAGWVVNRAVFIYYQDQDGNHRLKFNIVGDHTSTTFTAATLTVPGVVFKNISGYSQSCSAYLKNVTTITPRSVVVENTPTIVVQSASAAGNTGIGVSGDVELESRPSWA